MKVLIVGSGGREHALAWKLAQSPKLSELHAAPGNPGIAALGSCHPVRADDGEGLLTLAHSLAIDLVVIGPEVPLVAGVADELRHAGIAVFGPAREAAMLEGSKAFAKELMLAAGVPTAKGCSRWRTHSLSTWSWSGRRFRSWPEWPTSSAMPVSPSSGPRAKRPCSRARRPLPRS